MGGWIGFGVARYAPERVRSLLIGGAHPYRDSTWDAFRHVDGTKPDAFIAALEHVLGERITDDVKPRVIANDLRALSAAAQDRPSLDDVPQTMRIPCLLFVGEADARYSAVQQCAKQIMGATLRSFHGLTHVTSFMRSDQVLPHITQFLATVR
jgi:pimeloyl-ACP methyl ester carboxylesterase